MTAVGIGQHQRQPAWVVSQRPTVWKHPPCRVLAALQSSPSPGCSHGQSSVSDAYITMCYRSLLFPLRSSTRLYFWLPYIVAGKKRICLLFQTVFFPLHLMQLRSTLPAHEQVFLIVFVLLPVGSTQKPWKKKKIVVILQK